MEWFAALTVVTILAQPALIDFTFITAQEIV